MNVIIMLTLFLTAVFLIMLVLIQRGKGGGLVGALGGMGGQSAFGTKAGEKITWVTVGVATFWILLSVASVKYFSPPSSASRSRMGATDTTVPIGSSSSKGAKPGAPAPSSAPASPSAPGPAEKP